MIDQPSRLSDRQAAFETENRRGPLYDPWARLYKTMEQSGKLKLLHSENGKKHTPEAVTIKEPTGDRSNLKIVARADAHTVPGDTGIYLGVSHVGKDGTWGDLIRHYRVNNGLATDLDTLLPVNERTKDFQMVREVMSRIHDQLDSLNRSKIWERQERRRRVRQSVGAIVAAGAVGVGSWAGIEQWVIEPAREAEVARVAYDAEGHEISGEGVAPDSHPFAVMSQEEFESTPLPGANETELDDPRRVTIYGVDECVAINVPLDDDSRLYAALPEDSLYASARFGTAPTEKGFELCLTDDLLGDDESLQIALQVRDE